MLKALAHARLALLVRQARLLARMHCRRARTALKGSFRLLVLLLVSPVHLARTVTQVVLTFALSALPEHIRTKVAKFLVKIVPRAGTCPLLVPASARPATLDAIARPRAKMTPQRA